MLKYNPFNQELANVIDSLKQQVAQLRNDVEFCLPQHREQMTGLAAAASPPFLTLRYLWR